MPHSGSTSVKMKARHYQKLKEAARTTGYSITYLLDEALEDYTDNVLPTTVDAIMRLRAAKRLRLVTV